MPAMYFGGVYTNCILLRDRNLGFKTRKIQSYSKGTTADNIESQRAEVIIEIDTSTAMKNLDFIGPWL